MYACMYKRLNSKMNLLTIQMQTSQILKYGKIKSKEYNT